MADEAENIKVYGRSDNASVDAQMNAYLAEGMRPFSGKKFPIVSGEWVGGGERFTTRLVCTYLVLPRTYAS